LYVNLRSKFYLFYSFTSADEKLINTARYRSNVQCFKKNYSSVTALNIKQRET